METGCDHLEHHRPRPKRIQEDLSMRSIIIGLSNAECDWWPRWLQYRPPTIVALNRSMSNLIWNLSILNAVNQVHFREAESGNSLDCYVSWSMVHRCAQDCSLKPAQVSVELHIFPFSHWRLRSHVVEVDTSAWYQNIFPFSEHGSSPSSKVFM